MLDEKLLEAFEEYIGQNHQIEDPGRLYHLYRKRVASEFGALLVACQTYRYSLKQTDQVIFLHSYRGVFPESGLVEEHQKSLDTDFETEEGILKALDRLVLEYDVSLTEFEDDEHRLRYITNHPEPNPGMNVASLCAYVYFRDIRQRGKKGLIEQHESDEILSNLLSAAYSVCYNRNVRRDTMLNFDSVQRFMERNPSIKTSNVGYPWQN